MRNLIVFQRLRKAITYIYIFMVSFFMSLYGTNNPFQVGCTGIDSSVFIYVAKVIVDGGMPYRDTFDHKGPLIYLIDALGLLINEDIGIWIIELISIFVIFLFAYKIARLLDCNCFMSCFIVTIGLFVLSYYFEGGNFTEEYACVFITVSLYWFLDYFINGNIKRYRIILCGVSFAAVCMLRVNMIILWIVMCIGFLADNIHKHQGEVIPKIIYEFLIGVALVIVPISVWLLLNNAFDDFVYDYLIFNFMYSSDPERASAFNILESIKAFIISTPVMISLPFLLYFSLKKKKLTDLLCVMVLLLSIIASCISGQRYGHYGIIFFPLIIYALSRTVFEIGNFEISDTNVKVNSKIVAKFILITIYLSLVFCFLIPFLFSFVRTVTDLFLIDKRVISSKKTKIASIIQTVTNKDDKITVVGNGNFLYLLSKRKSASKYSYQYPIANINNMIWEEYLRDIENTPTKLIIILPNVNNFLPYNQIKEKARLKYDRIETIYGCEIYLLKKVD